MQILTIAFSLSALRTLFPTTVIYPLDPLHDQYAFMWTVHSLYYFWYLILILINTYTYPVTPLTCCRRDYGRVQHYMDTLSVAPFPW
jgi:hypothetical protein